MTVLQLLLAFGVKEGTSGPLHGDGRKQGGDGVREPLGSGCSRWRRGLAGGLTLEGGAWRGLSKGR